ncbi:MAG: response regulator transcription factor [Bacillota bacterium]|nr:response regulator transcription factor [Bacillota bacterium]
MADPTILIVEDDHMIAELLAYNLKEAGYLPMTFQDGRQLFRALEQNQSWMPDLFILDLMLPGMDGYEICQKLRQMNRYEWIPILMLTARGSETDKVRGLDSGADDYLTKPFGMKELLARVNALHRRYQKTKQLEINADLAPGQSSESRTTAALQMAGQTERSPQDGLYRCRDLLLDDVSHRVLKQNHEVEMTNREYELLKFLIMNRGIAFSRDDLLNHVWGFEYGGETRTVDVHIRQLRRKIEDNDAEPVMIETVRGRGYRFNDQIG